MLNLYHVVITYNGSIFTKKESLKRVLRNGGKVALAILEMKTIVGFASLDFPNSKNRWGSISGKTVMELDAVEVIPDACRQQSQKRSSIK